MKPIATLIICALLGIAMPAHVIAANSQPAQPQTQKVDNKAFLRLFIEEYNKQCKDISDATMDYTGCSYNEKTNTFYFYVKVKKVEDGLDAASFRLVAADAETRDELMHGFFDGNDDLYDLFMPLGCSIVFQFIFPAENNATVDMVMPPAEIKAMAAKAKK